MKAIRKNANSPLVLDDVDRKILRLLAIQADRSYSDLSELVHLSPPAIHERIKRMRLKGVILSTVAKLDGGKIGCPLLAFIHVKTGGLPMTEPILALQELADVEEIHTAAGDTSLILKVRCADSKGLEKLLSRIQEISGVRSTYCYVTLSTYLERGPMPEK
ncbi:Lrp/AsnC family transcriptional regulator [Klebsiella sp. S69]|uniref:Lrp/AsnC family transcriptional regulator n=1 Tax=Klebsiella sp. S69 TaxID=2767439 RepID=UPI0019037D67|nr:Lrp/AsnC family transcriptional regulator [Klebsiella sp. S69]MBK0167412.1 Lrp/AsnC family transcriptional regulator [Klebsiella sp. S69]